jgi:uncharacterized membrane protein HdeD (DUF308 family)
MSTPASTLRERATDGIRMAFGVGGLVAIVLGLLILVFPGKSAAVALTIVAAIALVTGVVYLGSSLFSRLLSGWARVGHIVLGLLFVIGGIVMMANLRASATVLGVFLAITIGLLWVFEGIMALSIARESTADVWSIVYGVVSIIAGLVVVFSPLVGLGTLWLLLGVSMLVIGIVQVVRAVKLKATV